MRRALFLACLGLASGPLYACGTEQRRYVKTPTTATPYRGLNMHGFRAEVAEADAKHEIAEAAALGVNDIRVEALWRAIETNNRETSKEPRPESGATLKRLDLVVNEAARYGIKVDATIATTPEWASNGKAWNDAPTSPAVVKPFAKWLTERYGSKLIAVGALNEPNKIENLKKSTGSPFPETTEGWAELAKTYTEESNAIYEGAKEGNASIKVLVGETGILEAGESKSKLFLSDSFADGIKYSALAIEAYSECGPPESTCTTSIKSKIEDAHMFLTERGVGTKPIWINEWGWSNGPGEPNETVRAEYVQKGVELLDKGVGLLDKTFVHPEGWAYFLLRDTVNNPTNKEHNFGLLEYSFVPRPSFAAFQAGLVH
jgi:hypothetical protein